MTSWLAGKVYSGASAPTPAFGKAPSAAATKPSAVSTGTPPVGTAATDNKTSTSTSATPEVQISKSARVAMAEAADNRKSTDEVAKASRKTLDAQYGKIGSKHAQPDLTEMSGRALAVVALDDSSTFSRSEIVAAKSEINQRSRAEIMTAIRTEGLGSGLASYGKTMLASYEGMSAEERQARGWSEQVQQSTLRSSSQLSASSLFDYLA